jgi:hypothetical protein
MLVNIISYLIEVNRIKSLLKTWIKAFQHLFSLSLNSHLAYGAKEQHQRMHVDYTHTHAIIRVERENESMAVMETQIVMMKPYSSTRAYLLTSLLICGQIP